MAALLANPDSSSVRKNLAAETCMFFAVLAHDRNVGNVDRCFALHNSSLNILLRIWPRMTFDHLNALNNNPLLVRDDDQHATGLAAILAAQNINVVVLFDWAD